MFCQADVARSLAASAITAFGVSMLQSKELADIIPYMLQDPPSRPRAGDVKQFLSGPKRETREPWLQESRPTQAAATDK